MDEVLSPGVLNRYFDYLFSVVCEVQYAIDHCDFEALLSEQGAQVGLMFKSDSLRSKALELMAYQTGKGAELSP